MLRKTLLAAVAAIVVGVAGAQAAPLAPASGLTLAPEATPVHFGPKVVCTYHYHGFHVHKRCRLVFFDHHHHHHHGHHHGHHHHHHRHHHHH